MEKIMITSQLMSWRTSSQAIQVSGLYLEWEMHWDK